MAAEWRKKRERRRHLKEKMSLEEAHHHRRPWIRAWRKKEMNEEIVFKWKGMKYYEKITFFRIFGSRKCSNLSTSGARSRAISAEEIFPKAQRASPTIY